MARKNSSNIGVVPGTDTGVRQFSGTQGGNVPSWQETIVESDFTLTAASGVQSAFSSGQDVLTVEANRCYEFECRYIITTGSTGYSIATAFALTTATVSDFKYLAFAWKGIANTTVAAQGTVYIDRITSTVLTVSNATQGALVFLTGSFRTGTGGTITPQIDFSVNPTGTNLMKSGSMMRVRDVGPASFTNTSAWA